MVNAFSRYKSSHKITLKNFEPALQVLQYPSIRSAVVGRKKFRGFKVMAGLVGGPGAEPPGSGRIFENLPKNVLRKLQKCIILAYFSKDFKIMR